ncbi:MAG: C2H2-type zinc finger protein [Thermofilaceae archaeon]
MIIGKFMYEVYMAVWNNLSKPSRLRSPVVRKVVNCLLEMYPVMLEKRCPYCGRGFKSRTSLVKHVKKMHGPELHRDVVALVERYYRLSCRDMIPLYDGGAKK